MIKKYTTIFLVISITFAISGCSDNYDKEFDQKSVPPVGFIFIDGTPSYKFLEKAKSTAIKISKTMPANSKLYIRWITEDSILDQYSIISVSFPEIVKPKNPFDKRGKKKYKLSLARNIIVKKKVMSALTNATSPMALNTDIYGALYAASLRMENIVESTPMIFLLTDMIDNVRNDDKYQVTLKDAVVKIMDFQVGSDIIQQKQHWYDYLINAGAQSVEFIPLDEPLDLGKL